MSLIYSIFLTGGYLFIIASVLAFLEIQIEGKAGWAEKLPTWKWDSPRLRKLLGKPITGYHVWFNAMLLLFLHLPQVYSGFSFEEEAKAISFYFFLAVFWDFLWFVWNPYYGVKRFRKGLIWWYPSWFLGLPTAYFGGVFVSGVIYTSPAFWEGHWQGRLEVWGGYFGCLLILTLGSIALANGMVKFRSPERGE